MYKCKECGTLNEADYKYCKNCGAVLERSTRDSTTDGTDAGVCKNQYASAGYYNMPLSVPNEMCGVSVQDLSMLVGKNSDKIIPKWSVMTASHRKTSWCWPVFVLSFFFGLFGAAFWFLYRKMYKAGAILLACAVIMSVSHTVLTFPATKSMIGQFYTLMENFIENQDETALQQGLENILLGKDAQIIHLIGKAFSIISFSLTVVLSMFSYDIYRRFCVNRLNSFERQMTPAELSIRGGTSGGALAVGIVTMVIVNMMIFVTVIIGVL